MGETVFIVEDDPSVRKSLARLIRSNGWNVEAYASGTDFLRNLPSCERACVVLDITLPDANGLEVCNQMTALGCFLPVIFLTGGGDFGFIPEAVRKSLPNAIGFFTKPIDANELLNAVQSALMRP